MKKLDQIKEIYNMKNMDEVISFLLRHKFLIPTLLRLPTYISKVYKNKVDLWLEVDTDPESGDQELFVLVKDNLPIDESEKLLYKLCNKFYFKLDRKIIMRLNISNGF